MINTTKFHRFTMNATAWISPRNVTKSVALCFCYLMISGCIAQQADLARIQKDLEDQISKINQEKKALASEVAQAKDAINESKGLLAQQNTEMKDLFRARAEIKQQIKALRDSDLTNISGDIEQINFKIGQLQEDLETRNSQTGTRIESLEAQLNKQEADLKKQTEDLTAQQTQTTTLIQQVDQDGASISQKMEEFQTSLTTFKESMGELGNKFVQEAERDSRVEAELSQQVGQTSQLTKASTEDLQAHLDANKANIAGISQSLTELKEAMAQSSTLLGGRLDEHDGHVTQLLERTDFHQAKFQDVDTLTQAHATNIQELNQTALQLREHQDVMGSLLGKRGDNLIQQAGRLDERVNDLEAHQTSLDQTLETNRQNTGRHFQELTASISSMTQALQKTSGDFATRINTQDQLLNDLTQQVQELQVMKQNLDANMSQIQSASQGSTELRETVQQVTNRLHDLENHQSGITGKLDADVQSINSHLAEVNGAIVSVKDALSQVNGQLSTRIDQQERHLNQALTSFQSVQGAGELTQANMEHLNQLTETVNKLRDVVTTIGTKFGERVDQHESRLADLAKRINRFHSNTKKKKR